jgi:hypothetical protein
MRIDDKQLISKLQELLISETSKKANSTLITGKLIEELDERWFAYKNKTEKTFSFDQTKRIARQSNKASRSK